MYMNSHNQGFYIPLGRRTLKLPVNVFSLPNTQRIPYFFQFVNSFSVKILTIIYSHQETYDASQVQATLHYLPGKDRHVAKNALQSY